MTGLGCVRSDGNKIHLVEHSTLYLTDKASEECKAETRLLNLYQSLKETIERLKPDCLVVEKVFFAKNALSALKLGQARGVILLVGALHDLEVYEYSVTEVKQYITGFGRSDKLAVANSIELILGKQNFQSHDASDALGLALYHLALSGSKLSKAKKLVRSKNKKMSLAEALAHKIEKNL